MDWPICFQLAPNSTVDLEASPPQYTRKTEVATGEVFTAERPRRNYAQHLSTAERMCPT